MPPGDVLGVAPGASPREVRAAFRRFAAAHHPDRGGDPDRFRAGVDAYRRLTGTTTVPTPSTATADVVFHHRRRGLRRLAGLARRRRDARRLR
ncbi:MAG TPA: DnaJ domain-containing protein [Acidimicrobiales bacterium]|nr:DnaJ domain-containing protein [Acidimicrobiales bacterium]